MVARKLSRWLMSVVLAVFALVTINLLLASTSAQAHTPTAAKNQIRYVATAGSDAGNDCTNSSLPCSTIQHAVDVAAKGDEVRIASGAYTSLSVRPRNDVKTTGVVTQIVYFSKTLTLRGGYTTTNWLVSDPLSNPTVLDAQAQGRVIYVGGNISPTIEGLRLTNGNPLDMGYDAGCLSGQCLNFGGAVFAITATITLNNNQIDNNSAGAYEGGAIFLKNVNARLSHNVVMRTAGSGITLLGSSAVVSANVLVSNTSSNGGGLLLKLSTATVNNNQILSNTATYACGGGVCMTDSIVTLTGNIIRNNRTEGYSAHGAGVSIYFSTATLKSNSIENNIDSSATALGGGGIFLTTSDTTLIGNIIRRNLSNQVGGGISMAQGPNTAVFVNNVIAENQADAMGGGLYIAGSSARLVHNTFAHNTSGDGSGIYAADFYYGPPYSTVALTNTIIFSQPVGLRATGGSTVTLDSVLWHATPITITQTATTTIAAHNELYGDPMFVDPSNGNYHLQSGSAAIDHGINSDVYTDLDGHPRPSGLGFDIGAYEFQNIRYLWLPVIRK